MTYLLLSISRFKGVPGPCAANLPAIAFSDADAALRWLQELMKHTYVAINAWRTTTQPPQFSVTMQPIEVMAFEKTFGPVIPFPDPKETAVKNISNWLPDRISSNLTI